MSLKADTIYVSGLDASIGEDELRSEIFQECGTIIHVALVYDRNGKSLGQATIRFQNTTQAQKAQKDFDGAQVDGKRMSVQLIGVPVQPKVVVKAAPKPAAAAPAPKAAVKKTPAAKPLPPQQQRRPVPQARQSVRGASRPVLQQQEMSRRRAPISPVRPRRQSVPPARPAPSPRRQAAPPAGAKKAPAATKKAPAAAAKKAPATKKKPAAKKPVKKAVSAADLDAQMDKYNAAREAKSE